MRSAALRALTDRLPFALFVGLRYLRARRRERFISLITWIAAGGVVLGVATLNIVLAVMTGFEEDLRQRILQFQSHVVVRAAEGAISDPQAVLATVRSVPGVVAAAAVVRGQVMLSGPGGVTGVELRGIDAAGAAVWQLERHLKGGELAELFRRHPVTSDGGVAELPALIVGHEVARQLGLLVGDPVSVISPLATPSAVGLVPRVRRHVVVGWFESEMAEYDAALAYANLSDAQRFLELSGQASSIEVRTTTLDAARAVRDRLRAQLGSSFVVEDWMDVNHTLFSALQMEKTVYFLVLLLIVLVSAFNIVAMLILVVLEKRRDIAVLKALGATTGAIARIFHYKGMVIGALGTMLGSAIAFVVSALLERYPIVPLPENVFYVDALPVRFRFVHLLIVASASLLISFLATIYPARRAARLAPVEVLRSE
jgi:lipoprotein-releasing system permease protein